MSNAFDSFPSLPETLQLEALREGEARLQAQLQIATAADQRALTWGGLLVAAATGALGAGLALIGKAEPDYGLGLLAIGFSFSLMVSAWTALQSVQPDRFGLPGNSPANWLPDEWECLGSDRRKILRARREQAEQMSSQIAHNAASAKSRAEAMARSYRIARRTLLIGGLVLIAVMIQRNFGPNLYDIWQTISRFRGG